MLSLIDTDGRLTGKENEMHISSKGDRCSIGRGRISVAVKGIERKTSENSVSDGNTKSGLESPPSRCDCKQSWGGILEYVA